MSATYLKMNFESYKFLEPTLKPNKMKIPINNIGFEEQGVKTANEIYRYCFEQEAAGIFKRFVITPSQGISILRENLRGPRWHLEHGKSWLEMTIRNIDGCYYRFLAGYGKDEKEGGISGRRAFQIYTRELKKDGVDISDLATQNGYAIKMTIPSPRIDFVGIPGRTYYNVHHIDLNSAFNAGMINSYPVLDKSVRRMYNKRKENPHYKDVLNMTQGFMQSRLCQYKYSHISKAGYVWTNQRIQDLSEALKITGHRILAYNTDGIWYQGNLYHDDDEGTDIGQWKHDHVDCKIRFKSKGCYEYIDGDGVYKPVVRGKTTYEREKHRSEWVWGDIFKGSLIKYKFYEGEGLRRVVDT